MLEGARFRCGGRVDSNPEDQETQGRMPITIINTGKGKRTDGI